MARTKLQSPKRLKITTWEVFARFIRARDPWCVSCLAQGKQVPTTEAGHYKHNSERSQSLGGNALWFDARNVHGQCGACNRWKSGNLAAYALYLEEKYGQGILQDLNTLYNTPKKWTREDIEEKRRFYAEAFHALGLKGLGVIYEAA
jgi:hypothetical protein